MKRILTAAALCFLVASAFAQQQYPSLERGLQPEKLYQFNGIDNVNVFNGNLTILIPIGQSYPVDGGMAYQLKLSFNSNLWDFEAGPSTVGGIRAFPARSSNAGIGWILGFGRYLPTSDPENGSFADVYVAPDGGDHRFDKDNGEAFVKYTNDGTNLRLRTFGPSSTAAEIDFPDGTVQRHVKNSSGKYELREIRPPRGSGKVTIDTLTSRPWQCGFSTDVWWKISDPTASRNHYVCFDKLEMDGEFKPMVQTIVLDGPQGQSTNYSFAYDKIEGLGSPVGEKLPIPLPQGWRATHTIHVLKSITLPDQSSYRFTNWGDGAIKIMALPTGGQIEYVYNVLSDFPRVCICTMGYNEIEQLQHRSFGTEILGVTERKVRSALPQAAAAEAHVWTYSRTLHWNTTEKLCNAGQPNVVTWPLPDSLLATVTDPTGARTDSHFSVWPADMIDDSDAGYQALYNGFPYGPYDASQDRFRSQEQFQCSGSNCTKLRTTFVRHDLEFRPAAIPSFPNAALPWHRLASQRVAYHDDPSGCTAEGSGANCKATTTEWTDWDGLGHYRNVTTSHNFEGSPRSRTVTTDWNKFGGAARTAISSNDRWFPDEYEAVTTTENGATAKEQACFATVNGMRFLRSKRQLKGSSPGANDLVTTYSMDTNGNLQTERFFGGEATPLPSNAASQSTLCNALDFLGSPAYEIGSAFQFGVLNTSQYLGTNYFSLDLTIDRSGVVTESRDTAETLTKYFYDPSGRVTQIVPTGANPVTYAYANAVIGTNGTDIWLVQPARATQTRATSNGTAETIYQFDSFGRMWREKNRMPGSLWSLRETLYDAVGRKRSVSEWVDLPTGTSEFSFTPSHVTTYTGHDVFGRVGTIKAPDLSLTTFGYTGDRIKTRTSKIATSTTGSTSVTTTETYDGFGRLRQVVEPSGASSASAPIGANVTTNYTYDPSGRLDTVTMTGDGVTQNRDFNYDGRGLLLSETHPESGTTSYTYNARGKTATRTDARVALKFTYDLAEHLSKVFQVVSGVDKAIKEFEYGFENDGDNKQKGKLVSAIRHNELVSAGKIDVTETYTYAAKPNNIATGQLSKRMTLVERVVGTTRTPIQEFEYAVQEYDELGLPKTIALPKCLLYGCATPNGLSTVTYGRTNGLLTSIQNFGSLDYHPNGMVKTVTHQSSPQAVDTYDIANAMARPSKITLGGGTACPAPPSASPISAPSSVCANTATTASVPTRQGITHTWQISSGGTITSSSTGDSITFQGSGSPSSVTLTVTATDSCNATAQSSTTVAVNAAPAQSTITAPASSCANTVQTASVPARSGITHTWTITGGTWTSGTTGESVTFRTGTSGVTTLTVTATASCGSANSSKQVAISTTPAAAVSGSTQIVRGSGESAQLRVDLTGASPWRLDWNDGTISTTSTSPFFRSVTPNQNTTYSVVTVTSTNTNCSASGTGSATVTVIPAAPATVSARTLSNLSVEISWSPVSGITSYLIERALRLGNAPTWSATASGTFVDTVPASSGPVTYIYYVRAIDSFGGISDRVAFDHATAATTLWAEPITTGVTSVKASHVQELRNAIDAFRHAFFVPAAFAGSTPPSGPIQATDWTSLAAALTDGRRAAGYSDFVYNGVAAPALDVPILRAYTQQLRDALE